MRRLWWLVGVVCWSIVGSNTFASPSYSLYPLSVELPAGEVLLETNFSWNAVAVKAKSEASLPPLSYWDGTNWEPWHYGEVPSGGVDPSVSTLLSFSEEKRQLRIKVEKAQSVVFHFFYTLNPEENLVARFDPLDDDSFDNPRTGLPYKIRPPRYISREEWGADESLRVWKPGRGLARGFRKVVPEAENLPVTFRPEVVQKRNKEGKLLTWPLEKNKVIKKFIIHHTGEVTDEKRNPKALMRAIYYYHAITRGWGDIGYHYVIDKQGNIYEGRAGGPEIVGAHTAYYNVGTVGIALMGNFQKERPTKRQQEILALLLADHANRFHIDPTGRSYWLGKFTHNVAGHRQVAKKGHGTACPGKYLLKELPKIRKKAKALAYEIKKSRARKRGIDFLKKSAAAPKIQRRAVKRKEKPVPIVLNKLIRKTVLQRGTHSYLELEVKNLSKSTWRRGEKIVPENVPQGMRMSAFVNLKPIAPNQVGVFRSRVSVLETPNGVYQIKLVPKISSLTEEEKERVIPFIYPIQVSGNKADLKNAMTRAKTVKVQNEKVKRPRFATSPIKEVKKEVEDLGPPVKVKLSYFKERYAVLSADKPLRIVDGEHQKVLEVVDPGVQIRLYPLPALHTFKVVTPKNTFTVKFPQFKTEGVITIHNYDRGLGHIKYNRFRYQINAHKGFGEDFYLVNELPIEAYLWGLAEEPTSEPEAKKHAIYILARSYALVYSGEKRKFKTPYYDLEDSPKTSQLYLGYDWEVYHALQKKLVSQTKGMVITYKGKPVIGPYFTQSSGRSSSKWVSSYPWAPGRPLPYDEGLEQKGHGVGLSGNSARVLAEKGASYEEILKYFFKDIEIKRVY